MWDCSIHGSGVHGGSWDESHVYERTTVRLEENSDICPSSGFSILIMNKQCQSSLELYRSRNVPITECQALHQH